MTREIRFDVLGRYNLGMDTPIASSRAMLRTLRVVAAIAGWISGFVTLRAAGYALGLGLDWLGPEFHLERPAFLQWIGFLMVCLLLIAAINGSVIVGRFVYVWLVKQWTGQTVKFFW